MPHPARRWMRRAGRAGGRVLGAAWRWSRARSPSAVLFVWLLRAVALQELAAGVHVRAQNPAACPKQRALSLGQGSSICRGD